MGAMSVVVFFMFLESPKPSLLAMVGAPAGRGKKNARGGTGPYW